MVYGTPPPGLNMAWPRWMIQNAWEQLKKRMQDEEWNRGPAKSDPMTVNADYAYRKQQQEGPGGTFNAWLDKYGQVMGRAAQTGMLDSQKRDQLIDLLDKYSGATRFNPTQRQNIRGINQRLGVMPPEDYGWSPAQGLMDTMQPRTQFVGGAGVGGTALSGYGGPERDQLADVLRQTRSRARTAAATPTGSNNEALTQPGGTGDRRKELLQLLLKALSRAGAY